MTRSNFAFRATFFALLAVLFAAPSRACADTYQLVGLGIDNVYFYGMTDAGAVVLHSYSSCGNPATGCYETFLNGVSTGDTDVAPLYTWDYSSSICVGPRPGSPCTISDHGWTASIAQEPSGEINGLYVDSGSNPPQLLYTSGIGGIFAINSVGDIVFDDELQDEWYEAIDLTSSPVPEPAGLILLATGILVLATLLYRRRLHNPA